MSTGTEIDNPCTFKPCCRSCTFVENLADRPQLCLASGCKDYTPCSKCGKNVTLYADKKCAECSKKVTPKEAERAAESQELHTSQLPPEQPRSVPRKFSVTPPGTPPAEYSDEEREHYFKQWKEYEGYYRDPRAYPVAHSLVLLEIELDHVNSEIIKQRLEDEQDDQRLERLEKRRERIVNTMQTLQKQLPEKEAHEFSEDEKSIAAIYERYAAERLKRCTEGVTRVLSPEAIALAPALPYKLNLHSILTKMGYAPMAIENAIGRVMQADQLPRDPTDLLEALGMFVREKVIPFESTKEGPAKRRRFPQENPEGDILDESPDDSFNDSGDSNSESNSND